MMKMVYLSKNYKKNSFKKKTLLIIFFFLLILLFIFGQFSFINKPLGIMAKPLGILKNNSIEFSVDFFSFLKSKKKLVEENKFFKKELFDNKLATVNQKIILEENIALKKMLGKTDLESKLKMASVILKPGLSIYNSLILDIGASQGVKMGNKVIVGDNVIIGETVEVNSNFSKVKLYSFPKDKIEVTVGFDKILTIAEGKGGGIFEIKLPQGVSVVKGDVVTLPEEDLRILGIIEEIIINPKDPFEIILVKSPVNLFELRWAQIILES